MARIVVETSDRQTLLEEGDVGLADFRDRTSPNSLTGRVEAAPRGDDRRPRISNRNRNEGFVAPPQARRLVALVPTSYLDIGG